MGTPVGMTEGVFRSLEAKFGEVFFSHLAAYISATKYGLTEMELLDVLSCDQKVYYHAMPSTTKGPYSV